MQLIGTIMTPRIGTSAHVRQRCAIFQLYQLPITSSKKVRYADYRFHRKLRQLRCLLPLRLLPGTLVFGFQLPFTPKDDLRACWRYTEAGVSDASVSAGRAEPIDEHCSQYFQTIFFEPATRTPGSDPKEIVVSTSRPTPVPPRRLPQQPNLEQLKKQAKELLERFRASELTAVTEVRQSERNPDPSHFALNDAQRVLARAYGFESWPKLKA